MYDNRKPLILCIIFYLLAAPFALSQDNKVGDFGIKSIKIHFDNDVFFHTDQDYTTGLRIKVVTEPLKMRIPLLFGFPRTENTFRPTGLRKGDVLTYNFQTFGAALNFFTPGNIAAYGLIYNQRPYASNQTFSIGRIGIRKYYNPNFFNESTYEKISSRLTIGLTGGPAGPNLQRAFHNLIGAQIPHGWHNQIGGNRNIFFANYYLGFESLATGSMIYPLKKKKTHPLQQVYNSYQWYNIILGMGINLGTLHNNVSVYGRFNLFNFNRHYKYYLRFYGSEKALIPHINSAYLSAYTGENEDLAAFVRQQFPPSAHGLSNHLLDSKVQDIFRQMALDTQAVAQMNIQKRVLEKRNSRGEIDNTKSMDEIKAELIASDMIYYRFQAWKNFYLQEKMKYINSRWDFSFFIRPVLTYVAYNGNLQGPLFADLEDDYTIRYINPLVFRLETGFTLRKGIFQINLSHNIRSRQVPVHCTIDGIFDISHCPESHIIRLDRWHQWLNITLKLYPGMIGRSIKRSNIKNRIKRLKKMKNE